MVSPSEAWMREYKEALKLADEVNTLVSEASSLPPTGITRGQRHFGAARRKNTILKTKLETLEILRLQLPSSKQPISEKEMNKRKEMLANVSTKVDEMADTLNSYSAAYKDRLLGKNTKSEEIMKKAAEIDNRGILDLQGKIMKAQDEDIKSYSATYKDRLLGKNTKSEEIMEKAAELDNRGIVDFQRQIMIAQDEDTKLCSAAHKDRLLGTNTKSEEITKKTAEMENRGIVDSQRQIMKVQDEDLEKLEEAVVCTKHIAIAINVEVDLQTSLLDKLDDHVETTGFGLHRAKRQLAVLNKHIKGCCSYYCLQVTLAVIFLTLTMLALIKYL